MNIPTAYAFAAPGGDTQPAAARLAQQMIARVLGISEGTVKNHITEIFRALKATNRTQAAQLRFDAE